MAFVHYRNLEVFKKAYVLALEIHRVTATFPREELFGGMADQMRRASKGICANLAEGLGKGSTHAEQIRFLRIALGSLEELRTWFMFCKDLTYIHDDIYRKWDSEAEQIGKMLFGLIEKRTQLPAKAVR